MQDYIETDKRLHYLAQTLSKVSRNFVPKQEDDSHTNLSFDPLDYRLITHWMDFKEQRVFFSFNLLNSSYEWVSDKREVLSSISILGKNTSSYESEIADFLATEGYSAEDFSKPMHYAIPNYGFDKQLWQPLNVDAMESWYIWRRMAGMVCRDLLAYVQRESAVRIWPHHFDTGFFTPISEQLSIGFGWAMADDLLNAPYFYLAGYPSSGSIDYSRLNQLPTGKWITEGTFKGSVLPMHDLMGLSFEAMQPKLIGFMKASVNGLLRQV